MQQSIHLCSRPWHRAACRGHASTRADFIVKSCNVLVYLVTVRPLLNIPACALPIAPMWVSTRSIVLPGTVQRGRFQTGNATDPSKASNFKMHRPCSSCSGACSKACSSDCMSLVLHRSASYLPLAETFPLCFEEGEGKHKRLCLLSHSLPPSPSYWSFSGLLCNKDAKYKPRSSCTLSLFASEACVSVHRALVWMHGPLRRRKKR